MNIRLILVMVFLMLNILTVQAEDVLPVSTDEGLQSEFSIPSEQLVPGYLEATGTHFELKDSEYLNVTVDSAEQITLVLESVPSMVTMHLKSADKDITNTRITLQGFTPDTIYHMYEDDYHNHVPFTTDANGSYSYIQDLSGPHTIFIQPKRSTKFIRDDATGGDCSSIGLWDSFSKSCTMTTDLNETIQIDSDGIILDGNNYTLAGSGTGNGVYLPWYRSGVTVKNLKVTGFNTGIAIMSYSSNNTIVNNTISRNSNYGIQLIGSNNNTIIENQVVYNGRFGINLRFYAPYVPYDNIKLSEGNTLIKNTVSYNTFGVTLSSSNNNILQDNTATYNAYGITLLSQSNGNILTGNNASNNFGPGPYISGIWLSNSSMNTLTDNLVSYNSGYGIQLYYHSSNNLIKGNYASNNSVGLYVVNKSDENSLSENTVANNGNGISVQMSNRNALTDNTILNNYYGINISHIHIYYSNDNIIYHNNFIYNQIQAYVSGGNGNLFNLPMPTGGNYWSNWTTPDMNGDGFIDEPYIFTGGQDDLPWVKQDGWRPSDSVAPSTTIELSGTGGNNNWYTSDVQVTLVATDYDGSGVANTEYSFNNVDWLTYTIPLIVNTDGPTTIYYKSTDNADNVEVVKTQTINIDKTPPVLDLSTNPNILWSPNHEMVDVLISGSATDAASGIGTVTFSVMDEYGIIQPSISNFNATIQLEASREGSDEDGRLYTISAVASDAAGNITTTSTTVLVPHDQGN